MMKAVPSAPGTENIYFPGELEQLHAEKTQREGITLPHETWKDLNELADRFGVSQVNSR